MKTTSIIIVALLFITSGLSSCKKKNNDSDNPITAPTSYSSDIQQGDWRITNYNEKGKDETNDFKNYTLKFNENGTVTVVYNNQTFYGTWKIVLDSKKTKFYLNFGLLKPFEELNEDWLILEKTNIIIRLEHRSGGNGGVSYLTFEKI
jgi:uncharacterized protein YxeA